MIEQFVLTLLHGKLSVDSARFSYKMLKYMAMLKPDFLGNFSFVWCFADWLPKPDNPVAAEYRRKVC